MEKLLRTFVLASFNFQCLGFKLPLLTARYRKMVSFAGLQDTVSSGRTSRALKNLLMAESRIGNIEEPVLTPSSASSLFWDSGCVANPVVLPPDSQNQRWQCFYYGNSGGWADGKKCYLPTGWTGLAESDDGIRWDKIAGPLEKGAVFGPDENTDAWDGIHIGVGDIIRFMNGTLHMYYLGGSQEELSIGPGSIAGFRMRIGKAVSYDGGMSWSRKGIILDYDDSEGYFASWPRIIIPCDDEKVGGGSRIDQKPWRMLYHAFNGEKWRVFGATSCDQGATWRRDGKVLLDAGPEGAVDSKGCGTRAVARWRDGLLMIYEGVDASMTHRLCAAFCADPDGDYESCGGWEKLESPGGPILTPGGAGGAWTKQVVGTPYIVPMEGGGLRLYFCGKRDSDMNMSIGLLESEAGDLREECWRPLPSPIE